LESDVRLRIAPLLGLTLFAVGCDKQSEPPPQPKEKMTTTQTVAPAAVTPDPAAPVGEVDRAFAGKPMPVTAFSAPNGDVLTLAKFQGTPVLLNLWATWCGPCVAEMPTLEKLAEREAGQMQVITVSQDMKGRAAVDGWWNGQGFKQLQPYLDEKADMSFAMGGGTLPTTIMYDGEGKEVWRVSGALDWTGTEAKSLIDEGLDR
jgi:thiol-disulfide isomerase/thioredoxin